MSHLLISLIVLFSSVTVLSQSSYRIPTTRGGVTTQSLAYNFWSGEYPGPVIDVQDEMTVEVYDSLRSLKIEKSCTIEKGLYHPWSDTKNSVQTYYSIVDIFTYKALADVTDAEIFLRQEIASTPLPIAKNDVVTNVYYLSEGWCAGRLLRADGSKVNIDFFCDEIQGNPSFKSIGVDFESSKIDEQWMYLQCKEGYLGFIRDAHLLTYPNVKMGEITGYGTVGPAK